MKRKLLIPAMSLGLLAFYFPLATAAAKDKPNEQKERSGKTTMQHEPYLGVLVEHLHPSFQTHLPDVVGKYQGVLVAEVSPDSPAAKAGIVAQDILMTYNDQKLFSVEQLVKLVRSDRIGRHVTLGIVHAGSPKKVDVTLGDRDAAASPESHQLASPWWWPHIRRQHPYGQKQDNAKWEDFDAMSITKLGDHKFKAVIEYTDKNGKTQHHEFVGTRDEIRRKISAQKDMPANEQEHVLLGLGARRRSPNMPDDSFELAPWWPLPGLGWLRPYEDWHNYDQYF